MTRVHPSGLLVKSSLHWSHDLLPGNFSPLAPLILVDKKYLYYPNVLVIVQKARETSTNIPRYCTYMLFTSREVRIGKTVPAVLSTARGRRSILKGCENARKFH